jgi:predicted nuclease of predicted toxin-antitoxin system
MPRSTKEIGLLGASDIQIFDRAADDGDVLITADADFSMLLGARGSAGPSVVFASRGQTALGRRGAWPRRAA